MPEGEPSSVATGDPDDGASEVDAGTESDDDVVAALSRVTHQLPAAEDRPGQVEMAIAVQEAIARGRHLVVQAGTGTGKSLAYLVPAVVSGKRTVVATATKALQDQLAGKDLPFLAEHLGIDFDFAVLKGRANYVCRQRVAELGVEGDQLELEGIGDRSLKQEIAGLVAWADETETGDRAELDVEPSVRAWSSLSVTARECPGAARCPKGQECFTERARAAAAEVDVLVVNTHLYGVHLAAGGDVLPEHDVVVLDEAHQVEEIVSATSGFELSSSRFAHLARNVKAILVDEKLADDLETAGARLDAALEPETGRRLRGTVEPAIEEAIVGGRGRVVHVMEALRAIDDGGPGDVAARKQRAMKAATTLLEDIDAVMDVPPTHVAWIEGPDSSPTLKVAPVDVAGVLRSTLWHRPTVVLTSATLPSVLPVSLGLEDGTFDLLDVGSPFDYETNTILYCAAHLPEPRAAGYEDAMHDELRSLIEAAGGRTLALFTSWRAMRAAAEALDGMLPGPLLSQGERPKPALIDAFTEDHSASLFATMSFWQGVDVPGPSLSLVTVDRLPFPRPDEPLLEARRERARADAFRVVDLPRAATLLAQGAGRLIRTATDRGVVAVLDSRLATAGYRWDIVRALPPMRRTKDRAEVEAFLASLHEAI